MPLTPKPDSTFGSVTSACGGHNLVLPRVEEPPTLGLTYAQAAEMLGVHEVDGAADRAPWG